MNAAERVRMGKIALMIVFGTVLLNAWNQNSLNKMCQLVGACPEKQMCDLPAEIRIEREIYAANPAQFEQHWKYRFDEGSKSDHCKRKRKHHRGHEKHAQLELLMPPVPPAPPAPPVPASW